VIDRFRSWCGWDEEADWGDGLTLLRGEFFYNGEYIGRLATEEDQERMTEQWKASVYCDQG